MFKNIHEIVFHSNGGYDWETIYNMPIWLRKATFNWEKEWYDRQKEENDKQNDLINKKSSKSHITPPDYITKAPKK